MRGLTFEVTGRRRRGAGVTHEFFGMGKVVADAKAAQDFAAAKLRAAFGM